MSAGHIPEIHVGIVRSGDLDLFFEGTYLSKGKSIEGKAEAVLRGEEICVQQEGVLFACGREIILSPADLVRGRFEIHDVRIGIGFHWEQKEIQRFPGSLKLIISEGQVQAINLVPLEDYLASVISSEMREDSFPEFLKAHAILSRSWLLAQMEKQVHLRASREPCVHSYEGDDEYIRWYDREDHLHFHVCADDHCQRYQGLTRAQNPEVARAVRETAGKVLVYAGHICDARFSKCCGGVSEEFQYCWEPEPHPYLRRVDDNPDGHVINGDDLKVEVNARAFIQDAPEAFCNTRDAGLLSRVLNDYDLGSPDFYRWEVSYSQEEISSLIREKSGMDFGKILDLIPVERGESGRLVKLKIKGAVRTLTVGKELEIRRWLSKTHLYSSAFTVEKEEVRDGIPGKFRFRGAGWGHGVGLCQIGAAVMASRGYAYEDILKHYFVNAGIEKRYE